MTPPVADPWVVVGYDGSAGSDEALHWAVDEARGRRARLRVVSVFGWAPYGPPVGIGRVQAMPDPRELGEEVATRGRARAQQLAPQLEVSTAVHVDLGAAEALVRESDRAQLLVVGSRGRGGFAALVLGSTSTGVAMRASCPVVVVHRGRGGADPSAPGGPVVVGVDGSELSERAVGWAFDAAARRGVGLVAVHAWQPPWATEVEWALADLDLVRALRQSAAVTLAESLAGWSQERPDVPVEQRVVRAHPVRALTDASGEAQLLVVGSRGRGGFAGSLLGSVSQAALHHADCPVVVVRGGP